MSLNALLPTGSSGLSLIKYTCIFYSQKEKVSEGRMWLASLRLSYLKLPGIMIVFFFSSYFSLAQSDSTHKDSTGISTVGKPVSESLYSPLLIKPILTSKQIKNRTLLVASANLVGYGGIMSALAAAWYDNYTQAKLHSFDDSKEWLQMDKMGHFYGTWIESRANNEIWKWTGMERKKRIWISGLTSFAFQTTIEYLDGKSADWGWSWADFGANLLGSSTFITQELAWDEQRIKLKWSFHRKKYSDASLNQRSDVLFGKSTPGRFLKDYNGQTYWASATLKSFLPKNNFPEWLCISLGYGAEGMFGGTENIGKDDNGNIIFSRTDIKRYRQWYLAPDIDFTKIKTNKKGVKFLFTVLSAFKFPTPSLEFSQGKFSLHALHF
ncbi:MAG: DUF2279 domain-containing protein [Chitinophagaceae bacterium]